MNLTHDEQKAIEEQRNVNRFKKLDDTEKELVEFLHGSPGSFFKEEDRKKAIQKLLNEGCRFDKLAEFLCTTVQDLQRWLECK